MWKILNFSELIAHLKNEALPSLFSTGYHYFRSLVMKNATVQILCAPLSMGFSRHEYCSGLPCPPPGDLPDPEIEAPSLTSPALPGVNTAPAAILHIGAWGSPQHSPSPDRPPANHLDCDLPSSSGPTFVSCKGRSLFLPAALRVLVRFSASCQKVKLGGQHQTVHHVTSLRGPWPIPGWHSDFPTSSTQFEVLPRPSHPLCWSPVSTPLPLRPPPAPVS
ncbi:uncharacterized protein LOC129645921 isoform X5 [Bubalus kerabau]|uniref:uncharacterized protein LOC129645921 isoform X5 n=1 Tax=Bubalus carabanensis TaxID=3119969 RepID=UPI00244F0066|nr:uncharacterized protein LOC129645921 isoform X5 [Bubalus carabanensis]